MTGRSRRGAAISTWGRIETVTRQLELCAVRAGESVVLVADANADPALIDLFTIGVHRHGADATGLVVHPDAADAPGRPFDTGPAAAAVAAADLVVDLTGRAAAAVPVSDHLRILTVDLADAADLDRLVVHPGLPRHVERAQELLRSTGSLVLSSMAGTMLDVGLTDAICTADPGVAAEPGDRARWPGGIVWAAPRADIVNGSIVLMPGDLLVEADHVVRSPVRLEIGGGRITEILGDTADADLVRHALEGLDPDDAARIAGVGLGLACAKRSVGPTAHRTLVGLPLTGGRCSLALTGDPDGPATPLTICLGATSMTADQIELVIGGDLVGVVEPDVYELAACG